MAKTRLLKNLTFVLVYLCLNLDRKVESSYDAAVASSRLTSGSTIDITPDNCNKYTQHAAKCRENSCHFDCANELCSSKQTSCATASGCENDCFDICACRQKGCEYNFMNNRCRNYTSMGIINCKNNQFTGYECGRRDTRYSIGGEICWNKEPLGSCIIERIILAVNMNGQNHIDSNGISYQSFQSVPYHDPFNVKSVHVANEYKGKNAGDRSLYTTILRTKKGNEPGECITYKVPICQDGSYELSVKMMESVYDESLKRSFNVQFADTIIYPEIDIWKLTGSRYVAIDVNVNFQVSNRKIILKGFPPTELLDPKNVELAFCPSNCKNTFSGKFYISAFSIVRFKYTTVRTKRSYCKDPVHRGFM